MSSAPKSAPEDDVSRLFKQLDLAAFRFRSFDRPGGEAGDGDSDGSEFQSDASVEAAAVASTASPALPPAAPAALLPAPPSAASAAAVNAAFNRLLRHGDSRQQRLPGFRLALPRTPRVIEQTRASGHDLSINEVLNRLYRLGGSKISLIRQRGDV